MCTWEYTLNEAHPAYEATFCNVLAGPSALVGVCFDCLMPPPLHSPPTSVDPKGSSWYNVIIKVRNRAPSSTRVQLIVALCLLLWKRTSTGRLLKRRLYSRFIAVVGRRSCARVHNKHKRPGRRMLFQSTSIGALIQCRQSRPLAAVSSPPLAFRRLKTCWFPSSFA